MYLFAYDFSGKSKKLQRYRYKKKKLCTVTVNFKFVMPVIHSATDIYSSILVPTLTFLHNVLNTLVQLYAYLPNPLMSSVKTPGSLSIRHQSPALPPPAILTFRFQEEFPLQSFSNKNRW